MESSILLSRTDLGQSEGVSQSAIQKRFRFNRTSEMGSLIGHQSANKHRFAFYLTAQKRIRLIEHGQYSVRLERSCYQLAFVGQFG